MQSRQAIFVKASAIPRSLMTVWIDAEIGEGTYHANFSLSAAGGALRLTDGVSVIDSITYETIALYNIDGTTLIDAIVFGAQQTDISSGRFPDGSETFVSMLTPTPGAANTDPAADIDSDGDGWSDLSEYLADTDPNDPNSRFTAASFASSANRVYTLWRSTDLSSSPWEAVTGQTDIPGTWGYRYDDRLPAVSGRLFLSSRSRSSLSQEGRSNTLFGRAGAFDDGMLALRMFPKVTAAFHDSDLRSSVADCNSALPASDWRVF